MEEWKKTNFTGSLTKWFANNVDSNSNVDSDVQYLWPKILKRAETFDNTKNQYLSKEKAWLATADGCFLMNKVAYEATLVAKSLASLTMLIVWKDRSEAKALKSLVNKTDAMTLQELEQGDHVRNDEQGEDDEDDASDDSDGEEDKGAKVFQGEPMNPDFALGKVMLHLSIVTDLTSWGQDNWIEKAYFQMGRAREMAFGSYNLYGIEHMEGDQYCISVDCYIKNIKPTEPCAYKEGFVTGKGNNRIVATIEAAMLGYWKVANYQLENLLESKLQIWTNAPKYYIDQPLFLDEGGDDD